MHHHMKDIRSEVHKISSYQLNKVPLSRFDDKRFILSDGITSFAHGYKKKMMDYYNYMTPEEVAKRMIGLDNTIIDNSGIDLKTFNNILSLKGKRREVERRDKRVENRKLSKEASKTVVARLQKQLIERGKKSNLGAIFFAYKNI